MPSPLILAFLIGGAFLAGLAIASFVSWITYNVLLDEFQAAFVSELKADRSRCALACIRQFRLGLLAGRIQRDNEHKETVIRSN